MKKVILLSCLAFSGLFSFAQITVTPNQTAAQLANKIVATSGTLGVTISNPLLTCHPDANGEFSAISNLGIADGIVLGSGHVQSDPVNSIWGINGLPADFASGSMSTPGDADLDALLTMPTYDACVLEFDLQPVGTFVEFEYVFGSEEYPTFNCSAFNDIFAFFISGPGFSAPTNIALIPGTTTPVSINSVNDGTGGCSTATSYYVTNNDTTCTMNGFTTPLIATAAVTSGATYHLKLAVSDVADMVFSSFVVLKANSLKSGNTIPNGLNTITSQNVFAYPSLVDDKLTILNNQSQNWSASILDLNGRIVMQDKISSNQASMNFDLGALPKGTYILKLVNAKSGEAKVQKLTKL